MSKLSKRHTTLSKKMSLALRHRPEKFGVQLDDEGWTPLNSFLGKMEMSTEDLSIIIDNSDKQRFEIKDGKIRAYYGHSMKTQINRKAVEPPEFLYHGTSPAAINSIRKSGIKSMSRQHVHLSADRSTAVKVGKRKHQWPLVLKVHAAEANKKGIKFYHGNEDIWMSDDIPFEFVEVS